MPPAKQGQQTSTAIPRPSQTNPSIGRIRTEDELTGTNKLNLSDAQMQEMQARLNAVKGEFKAPSLLSRLRKYAIVCGVFYGIYYASSAGMLAPLFAMLSDNPAVKKMIAKLPPVMRSKSRAGKQYIEDPDHRNPKAVVQNFNNRLKSYQATLDSVADGTGDNRAVDTDGYESGSARVRRIASLPKPGILFPMDVGNVFTVTKGKATGATCKVVAAHGLRGVEVFQLDCQQTAEGAGPTESYYFSRDSLK